MRVLIKNKKFIITFISLIFIGLTIPLAIHLVKLRQEIRKKALEPECFTELFDNTDYKDDGATDADWNTSLSRLQLAKEGTGRHYFPRVATDGTNSYVAYMSMDGVRVAKFNPTGQPVSEFGNAGVSNPISSFWAMLPVYDIAVSADGGAYVVYHGNLLQRLDRTTGEPFWMVEQPESPCPDFTAQEECESSMCTWYDGACLFHDPTAPHTLLSGFYDCTGQSWTMTVDNDSHVYVGGGCSGGSRSGYYITKMKNGGERLEEKREKVLDVVPQYDDIDLVSSGDYLYLAWEQDTSCFIQKYNQSDLSKVGGTWQNPLEINNCYGYLSIAAEPEGNFYLLSHKTEDAGDLEVRKYDANKNYLWGPITLSGNFYKASLYFNAGHLYAAWRDFSGPQPKNWIQRFNTSNGNKIFKDPGLLLVSPAGAEAHLNANGPLVTVDDNGNAIATYVEWTPPGYFVEVTKVPPDAISEDDFIFQVSPPDVDMRYISPGRGQSITVAETTADIISAVLTDNQTLNGGSVVYYLSANNGNNWEGPVSPGTEWIFEYPGQSLKWRADLATPDTTKTPWVDDLTICWSAILPTSTPTPSPTTTPGPTATPTSIPCPDCPNEVFLRDEKRIEDWNYNKFLDWDDVANEEGYYIYRCFGEGCTIPLDADALEVTTLNPDIVAYMDDGDDDLGFAPGTILGYEIRPFKTGCTELNCPDYPNYVPTPRPTSTPTASPTPTPTATSTPVPTSTPTATASPTPTPTPIKNCHCTEVEIFRNGEKVDLQAIRIGDKLILCGYGWIDAPETGLEADNIDLFDFHVLRDDEVIVDEVEVEAIRVPEMDDGDMRFFKACYPTQGELEITQSGEHRIKVWVHSPKKGWQGP